MARKLSDNVSTLRELGYKVFHDVVGGDFNLDHVLIGPAGVFTVETKTHSKRIGDARVTFEGETIRGGGFEPDRDPLVQPKGSQVQELLGRSP
jgi:Nuclease-related domain